LLQGGRLLYSRHQALPKIFFGRLGQFAANLVPNLRQKSAKLTKTMSKKMDGLARKEGG